MTKENIEGIYEITEEVEQFIKEQLCLRMK